MTAAIAILTVALSAPLTAQWLNHPTPGIPRTPAGKPNLAAPAPRTPEGKPDLSGIWNKISPKYARNIAADLKPGDVQPWAEALVQQRTENLEKDYMNVVCVPLGPGYSTAADSNGATLPFISLIPGQAGIQLVVSGSSCGTVNTKWVPAFAGTSGVTFKYPASPACHRRLHAVRAPRRLDRARVRAPR